ncbi:MAG TPA: protein translocase subunit SecF [Streptosporangiaceae bacterium]
MSRITEVGGRLYRGELSINFVDRRKMWYAISAVILLISIVAVIVRGLAFSVDFKGGATFQFYAPSASVSQVQTAVNDAGVSGAVVQHVTGAKVNYQVQTKDLSTQVQQQVISDLGSKAGASNVNVQFVGPSWGSQITGKAIEALIAFLIVIVIYLSIAFEWKMAVASFVALLHTIVITIGVYALAGFQVSPATVIGFLTILGYALYDTVVVFDKVRENTAGILGGSRQTYSEAANLALNQTLVRSINTSLIAILPVTSILVVSLVSLAPGNELSDLALVLLVGILSGAYASICIATPVLAQLKEREPQYQALAKRVALRSSGGRAAKRAAAKASGRGGVATQVTEDDRGDLVDGDLAVDDDLGVNDDFGDTAAAAVAQPDRVIPNVRPGPRQQPRRDGRTTASARRRPAGKKKRR